jgi:hypothetical protein
MVIVRSPRFKVGNQDRALGLNFKGNWRAVSVGGMNDDVV